MYENLEHDRMTCANYDRQSVAFFDEFIDDGYYFTFNNDSSIIDEIQSLSCDRHETSELIEKDWKLSEEDDSLMIGGLRSPCLNACYSIDSCDELGMVLRTFDGIFESGKGKGNFLYRINVEKIVFGGRHG